MSVPLSSKPEEGQCWCWQHYPKILLRRSCLSLFFPVRIGQLTSLGQPGWCVIPQFRGSERECCVMCQSRPNYAQYQAGYTHSAMNMCAEVLLTPLLPELCGPRANGGRTNWGRNTRAKRKRLHKPTAAGLSHVAPAADDSSLSAALLVHSYQP